MIYKLFSKLKRTNYPFKSLVNLMYDDSSTVILHLSEFDYVVVDGYKFKATDQIVSLQRVENNLWFANVREDDVCVDIGANIGAITIPLAFKSQTVYAVEPIFHKELVDNVRLNKLDNVVPIPYGIGKDRTITEFEFSSGRNKANCISFKSLKEFIGQQIDFLKMDCEGCEWQISPDEFEGIRELRIEFHFRRGHKQEDKMKYRRWEEWLDKNNYRYVIDKMKVSPCVPFFDYFLLNASKRESK